MKVNLKFEFAHHHSVKQSVSRCWFGQLHGSLHPFLAHRACKFLHIYRL